MCSVLYTYFEPASSHLIPSFASCFEHCWLIGHPLNGIVGYSWYRFHLVENSPPRDGKKRKGREVISGELINLLFLKRVIYVRVSKSGWSATCLRWKPDNRLFDNPLRRSSRYLVDEYTIQSVAGSLHCFSYANFSHIVLPNRNK